MSERGEEVAALWRRAEDSLAAEAEAAIASARRFLEALEPLVFPG